MTLLPTNRRPALARLGTMLGAGALVALAAAACTLDDEPIAPGRDQLVVHAVLNPRQLSQVLLLERTLSGRASPDTSLRYDSLDAVVSRGGVPVSGATVVVVSETGDSAVAREDLSQRTDGRGAGMYRFRNVETDQGEGDSLVAIVPGRRYTLHIRTADDEVVTGSTLVPSATPVQLSNSARAFDRDVDSIFAFWQPVPDAARYIMRVDGARGPFQLFVDSAQYLIAGSLRNTNVSGLPAVFFPGFDQRVSVGAVDRNYFDYYRSSNDPFTGSGLVTHLDGALGVFGAYVLVYSSRLTVSETLGDEAWEGDYDRQVPYGSAGEVPATFRLYLESADGPSQRFSGNWRNPISGQRLGLVGSTSNDFQITIALLAGQSARDTLMVLDLQPRDGRLIGHVRETGLAVEYLFRPPP